jgi:hypothetical protein
MLPASFRGKDGYFFFNDQTIEFVPKPSASEHLAYPESYALITLTDGTAFKCAVYVGGELECPYRPILLPDTGNADMDRARRLDNLRSEAISIEIARLPLAERLKRFEEERKKPWDMLEERKKDRMLPSDPGYRVSRWSILRGRPMPATEVPSKHQQMYLEIRTRLADYVAHYREAWKRRLEHLEFRRRMSSPGYESQAGILGILDKLKARSEVPAPSAEEWAQAIGPCLRVEDPDIHESILGLQAALRMIAGEFRARERETTNACRSP